MRRVYLDACVVIYLIENATPFSELTRQFLSRNGLKTPDALHLATAFHHGCTEIWTNDERLNKAAGSMAINVLAG